MPTRREKRIAKVNVTLTSEIIEALKPLEGPWIAWDDQVTGFGVRVQPTGTKSFLVNYRTGSGGRSAKNRRVVLGRVGRVTPEQARRRARDMLARVAAGSDPADDPAKDLADLADRAEARARGRLPTLREAFTEYLEVNPNRKASTVRLYRGQMRYCFADWAARPLDAITRRDVETRFHLLSDKHGRATANHAISLLRSAYRRPCVDFEKLRNPVELWLAGGGRYHPNVRRRIAPPSEVLPRWRRGIEAEVIVPATRDIFWFGMYTGMRVGEVFGMRWDRVNLKRRILRIEETKTGTPLTLPMTQQLAAILERRRAERLGEARAGAGEAMPRGWVFPSSTSASGHAEELWHLYRRISRAAGTKFWFHGFRNCFITVAERELMLPRSLTKRLVNHTRHTDVTEGYAADWTIRQLRGPAQRIADRIDELVHAEVEEDPDWNSDPWGDP